MGNLHHLLLSPSCVSQLLKQGCQGSLVYVKEDTKAKLHLFDIPIVYEFPDIFLDELPGLSFDRNRVLQRFAFGYVSYF